MATINGGRVRHSLGDFDNQKRQYSFDTDIVTAANHDAQKALHDSFIAAVAAVTLGTLDFEEFVGDREEIRPYVKPTVIAAQVNIQWVFTYVDDVTGATFNVRIPTADLTDDTLLAAGSNLWDPTDAKWVTMVTDFEAYIIAPTTGNAVTLSQVAYLQ